MKMQMIRKTRRILAVSLAMALLATGCGSRAKENDGDESTSADDSGKRTYTVEVISDSDDAASTLSARGIRAAADEKLRTDDSNLKIQFETGKITDKDLKEIVKKKPDLIIANGERSLVAAAKATTKIPIVAANVMNYQQIVGIEAADSGDWDRLTGRNITGVSSAPNVTATLSLIIEATEKLDSVGILYTSYDDDAVFQDARLEDYLDEAGIKWTEYEVPLPGQNVTAQVPPADTAALSGNQASAGTSVSANGAGESVSGNSAAAAGSPDDAADNAATGMVSSNGTASAAAPAAQQVVSSDQVIAQAVSENSVIFVSRNSLLSGRAQTIATVAQNAGKGVIAEDQTFGQHALATLYSDPYDEGYKAGTMAASILVDGKNIEKMKVQNIGIKDEHKLYNADYAKKLGITFPKSFTEFNTFFKEQSVSENSAGK